ncbi:pentapeptide repeat-containing protein [Fluoribacter gormanii]|uniref:pentapeptide repeat-containing protein n=3 Tax=Fluoribacter gormanii TaxID=464 RepID=UPI0007D9E711|nr:pentapeptide repeat-containing protein [Fluoribacter gormanii]
MNDKHDQNQQEQMAMVRAERARQFAAHKAKEEAKGLLEQFNGLNEFFQRYAFPKDTNADIYATAECTNQYVTAVLELQPVLSELIKKWDGIESDLRLLSHAMQERSLATDKSRGLGDSFEHDLTHFFKCLSVLQEHLNEVTSRINDRDEERRYHDQSILVEVRVLQEHLQQILLQLSGAQLHDVDEKTVSAVATAPSEVLDATEDVKDINQDNPLFALPDEMMMSILVHVPPQDLLNARWMAKSKTAVVDATLEMITQPHFIIDYLSHVDGFAGHQFTAFYQRTQRYQELKRKVLANEPLTAEEAICYTLTRDCNVLPANLKEAMQELPLDETTRNHLELISTASQEIRAIDVKLEELADRPFENVHDAIKNYRANLLECLKLHHPHQFVNVLAGANFSGGQFSDQDFSYLNLRGIRFRDTNLRGANFTGACLAGVNLNGALLLGADFTDAELRGVQLNRTNFDGMDLSAINLEGIDFEWAYIRGAKLLPTSALNSPEELHAALAQFEQSIAKHSSGSRRKLQEHLLAEIAHQLETSTEHSIKEKIALLDVALAEIDPAELIVGLFPFQNACLELKEKMTATQPKQDTPEHPLKNEAKDILERIFALLNGAVNGVAGANAEQRTPREINRHAYRDEYRLLMGCIKKYPELDNSLKVSQALGISPEIWHMLYITCPAIIVKPTSLPPILAAYHRGMEPTSEGDKYYASEVFNGHQFDIQALQKIKRDELDQYLYEEEDFAIFEGNGRTEVHVKLGDLFITFCPGGKGSVFSKIDVIDFMSRKLKPAFSLDLDRYGSIPFEAFMPLDPFVNYDSATFAGLHLTVDDMQYIQEAYTLKKQIIERIFTSEKMNRHHKKELFFPIFEQHEAQEKSQLASLPEELLQMVCAYVHANTLKQHKHISPLAEVNELHGLFFTEKNNPVHVKKTVSTTSKQDNEKEKGAEKEVIEKENQLPKSTKLAASKGQGLFAAIQKEIAQQRPVLVVPPKSNIPEQSPRISAAQNVQEAPAQADAHAAPLTPRDQRIFTAVQKEVAQQRPVIDVPRKSNIPEQSPRISVAQNVQKAPTQAGTHTAPQVSNGVSKTTVPNQVAEQRPQPVQNEMQNNPVEKAFSKPIAVQGPRMFPSVAEQRPQPVQNEMQNNPVEKAFSKPIAVQGPRMFPTVAERGSQPVHNEMQSNPSKKALPKPIAVDVANSSSCLIS